MPKGEKKKKDTETDDTPSHLLVSRLSKSSKREKITKTLDEYIELIVAAEHRQKTGHVDDFLIKEIDDFPTLQVGYLTRAIGLNVSNSQIVDIVSLAEGDLSTGYVLQTRLKMVLTDALLTGMIGGPTLFNDGLMSRNNRSVEPSCCIRDDERHIFRAFRSLDKHKRGYLLPDELRSAMMDHGDGFDDVEMEEMLLSVVDPEDGNIYYKNFADILARE